MAYRPNDLLPRECEECNCQEWRWNGESAVLRSDPPSTCACGHRTSRHRFRRLVETNSGSNPGGVS